MVYEASLTGVLRIILWIIAISFILRLIARMTLPYVMKKAEENMRQRMADFQQQQRQEGDVTIQSGPRTSSTSSNEGEYVDYVEIKD
ncbi:MAG TPA: DUF4834 domain-containing protein [Flavobacteriales bacterium]|jgi:hypothetical protein